MSERKTITVELTEDEARELLGNEPAARGPWTSGYEAIRAALPPEWAEGTLARVEQDGGTDWIAEWDGNGWRVGSVPLVNVTKVEPLRVLADDEIAVPKPAIHPTGSDVRWAARVASNAGNALTSEWLDKVADALEAEERAR